MYVYLIFIKLIYNFDKLEIVFIIIITTTVNILQVMIYYYRNEQLCMHFM